MPSGIGPDSHCTVSVSWGLSGSRLLQGPQHPQSPSCSFYVSVTLKCQCFLVSHTKQLLYTQCWQCWSAANNSVPKWFRMSTISAGVGLPPTLTLSLRLGHSKLANMLKATQSYNIGLSSVSILSLGNSVLSSAGCFCRFPMPSDRCSSVFLFYAVLNCLIVWTICCKPFFHSQQ